MRSEAYRIGLALGTGLEKNAGFLANIGRWMGNIGLGKSRRSLLQALPAATKGDGSWKNLIKQQLRGQGAGGVGLGLGVAGAGYGLLRGMGAPATPPPFDPEPFMQMMATMQQQQQQPNPYYDMPREINILR